MTFLKRLRNLGISNKDKQENILLSDMIKRNNDTLAGLVDDGHTYWKFSQSQKGRSIESVYAQYEPGMITIAKDEDKLLSFVNETSVIKCYIYGDTLTKFAMDDQNPLFKIIEDEKVRYIGGGLGEYECKKLLTEKYYSLEDIETIRMLFQMAKNSSDIHIIFQGLLGKNLESYLRVYKFENSANLLKFISENYYFKDINNSYAISENIDFIIEEFEKYKSVS
jgi:hypothetical protein